MGGLWREGHGLSVASEITQPDELLVVSYGTAKTATCHACVCTAAPSTDGVW